MGGDVAWVWGLGGYLAVATVTPGPNNLHLAAASAGGGWRPCVPHLAGIVLGFLALAGVALLGLAALLAAVPGAVLALRLAATAWLLWLAWRMRGLGGGPAAAMPAFDLWRAAAFQAVNPKVLGMVVACVAFLPPELPLGERAATLAVAVVLIMPPCMAVWIAAGLPLSVLLAEPRWRGPAAAGLALLTALAAATMWL
ncbi:MAG: LysE family transporter [Planctomycetes bacterium]|nr:LysE family transporter [Planctomycetota bacterium]